MSTRDHEGERRRIGNRMLSDIRASTAGAQR
jgi:hypothetical protein